MLVKDILDKPVSVFTSTDTSNPPKNLPLGIVLNNLADMWKDYIIDIRKYIESGNDVEYKKKKKRVPCWLVHGTCNGRATDNQMSTFNNIIALDIDVKDGENDTIDIDTIRRDLFDKPYTVAALRSLSGRGLYILVAVEDHTLNKGYYTYFNKMLKKKYGINLDMKATNPARKRILSWEEDLNKWIKPLDYDITPWRLYVDDEVDALFQDHPIQQHEVRRNTQATLFGADETYKRTHLAIKTLLDKGYTTNSYHQWYWIARLLANYEDGRTLFDKLCSNWGSQDAKIIEQTWKSAEKDPLSITDEIHKEWQGIAKVRLGARWWDKI